MKVLQTMTALSLAALLAMPAFAKDLATINGKGFTEEQYRQGMERFGVNPDMVKSNPEIRQQLMDHLVNSQLLADAADKAKIQDSKEFKDKIAAVSREIMAQIYLENYMKQEASESKQKDYFSKNKAKFEETEVRASHILFKDTDEKTAQEVMKEVQKKGVDFAALAKKHSIDPNGKEGGDLNFFKKGQMVPEFEEAAFATKKGELHPKLVKTRFGYHIIKVTDRKDGKDVKFEDKKEIVGRMMKKDLQDELFKKLRTQSNVKIDDAALKELKL